MSDGLHTLGRWTRDRALATPDRVAVDDRGVTLRYRDLHERASALAAAFRAAGYGVGDRVATVTGNSADQVVLFFACAQAGLVLAPLSWRLTPRELAAQLEIADPAVVLVEQEFTTLADVALARLPRPPRRTALGRSGIEAQVPAPTRSGFRQAQPAAGQARPAGQVQPAEARSAVHDDDPLLLVFTSGTGGGAPKGVLLTHAACFWTNLSFSRTVDLTSRDVVLTVLPQFHAGGWNIQTLLAWWTGATVVLERTFEPERVLQLIAERRVTTMMGVPTHYLLLAEHPDFAAADLSSLRLAVVGGAPRPEPLLRTWPRRGVALTQGYGLTEAGPNVLCLPDDVARDRAGWAGTPYPHVEVAVADPVTGEVHDDDVPATGELLVRGPGLFAGYFRDPQATAEALAGGWLHTGDLVERDAAGYYRGGDRLKDVFISGGENVAPAEVEAVLAQHPGVAEVAVVGVPDHRWGEVGAAFVVPRTGRHTDAEELTEHCRERLAGYKVPRTFTFVSALPRTSLDKVSRARLAAGTPTGAPVVGPPEVRS